MFQTLNNTTSIKYELFKFVYEKFMNPILAVVSFFKNYKKNNNIYYNHTLAVLYIIYNNTSFIL